MGKENQNGGHPSTAQTPIWVVGGGGGGGPHLISKRWNPWHFAIEDLVEDGILDFQRVGPDLSNVWHPMFLNAIFLLYHKNSNEFMTFSCFYFDFWT